MVLKTNESCDMQIPPLSTLMNNRFLHLFLKAVIDSDKLKKFTMLQCYLVNFSNFWKGFISIRTKGQLNTNIHFVMINLRDLYVSFKKDTSLIPTSEIKIDRSSSY